MLACKRLITLFVSGSNRATAPNMSKISCEAAGKLVKRAVLRMYGGGVLNSYEKREKNESKLV